MRYRDPKTGRFTARYRDPATGRYAAGPRKALVGPQPGKARKIPVAGAGKPSKAAAGPPAPSRTPQRKPAPAPAKPAKPARDQSGRFLKAALEGVRKPARKREWKLRAPDKGTVPAVNLPANIRKALNPRAAKALARELKRAAGQPSILLPKQATEAMRDMTDYHADRLKALLQVTHTFYQRNGHVKRAHKQALRRLLFVAGVSPFWVFSILRTLYR